MPWKVRRVMSQKLEFIEKASTPGANISELCREYGISRQTGHKWLRRYRQKGYVGLSEQSRRPLSTPLATGEEIVVRILELRDRHLTWGPDKIARVLERTLSEVAPSRSTVSRVLQRLGKIRRQRRRVRIWTVDGRPRVEVKAPNEPVDDRHQGVVAGTEQREMRAADSARRLQPEGPRCHFACTARSAAGSAHPPGAVRAARVAGRDPVR